MIENYQFLDDLNKLHSMWQTRSHVRNIPISQASLSAFMQHSRLLHYCHTPLLFLTSWRMQSAATRDHSLTPPADGLQQNSRDRSRAPSDASSKKVITEWHKEICELMIVEYKNYLQTLGFNSIQIESVKKM